MRADVARDMARADRAVRRLVWPVMEPVLGWGELVVADHSGIGGALDMMLGVDYLLARRGGGGYLLASRVQFEQEWSTFTVRDRGPGSELGKRLDSWRRGDPLPDRTMHAYVSETRDRFLSGAVVNTRDLIRYHDENLDDLRRRRRFNGADGTPFTHVPWCDLRAAGADLTCVGGLGGGLCRGCGIRALVYSTRDTQLDGRCLDCWRAAA